MAAFVRLGVWQLGRMHDKQAMLAAAQQVLSARVTLPLSAAADRVRAHAYDWAGGEGRFVDAPAVLLDNQQRAGRTGVRVYRAFQPDAAAASLRIDPLLIELGWLPLDGTRHLPEIALPAGSMRVQGLLAPPPSAGIARSAAAVPQANGTLLAMTLGNGSVAQALQLPALAPRVLRLDPALPLGYARDLEMLPNTLPPQKHLGYAVQWFALALTVLVTALILTLRKSRLRKQHREPPQR